MGGTNGASWVGLFLRERPGAAVPVDLEARLSDVVQRATRAWPEVAIDGERLVVRMAHRLGDDVEAALVDFCAEDFALAGACADRVPGAVGVVDRLCHDAIAIAIARIDRSRELCDEVRQTLWQRLFIGTPEQPPRILSYAGRGPLAAFVAVAAQRIALDLRRDAARAAGVDPAADQVLPIREHPEADYMRERYRSEFEAAVREALVALPDRDRLLLRLITVSGLSHDQIATIYKVNQSTVSRWIARARGEVLQATERVMCGQLGVPPGELQSLAGLLLSRIDLSLSRVLGGEGSSPGA
jgi:RNA polymerase sigma-70 factor (ECF subfamily)